MRAIPRTAWTEIGPTCSSNSNANAVKITIRRASGTVYGPVSNLFGGILGFNTSQVAATAIAYLGYTNEVQTATVKVPLTLPDTVLTASKGSSGWFARLFGPRRGRGHHHQDVCLQGYRRATWLTKNVTTAPIRHNSGVSIHRRRK